MNYASITKYDVNNGPGIRISLFVQGCSIRCPGCHNSQLWYFNNGTKFTKETVYYIAEMCKDDKIDGLSILGGEPMDQDIHGIYFLYTLCQLIHDLNKTVWLYTGYNFEEFRTFDNSLEFNRCRLIENCDVVVDGKYDESLRDLSLAFRGSKNQRIIDVKESLKKNKVICLNI